MHHLDIDAEPNLESLRRDKALEDLMVWLSETSKNEDCDTLPPLPDLRLLRVRFVETLSTRDTSASRHHHLISVDLSLSEGLTKLELRVTACSAMWSESVVGSSHSIERLLVDQQWRGFYPRLTCLWSSALFNATAVSMGDIVVPLSQSLEIENRSIPDIGYPLFICPRL